MSDNIFWISTTVDMPKQGQTVIALMYSIDLGWRAFIDTMLMPVAVKEQLPYLYWAPLPAFPPPPTEYTDKIRERAAQACADAQKLLSFSEDIAQ